MTKHTRIYTRTGDDGSTGLYKGGRVPKNDPRIEAYGTVDELSSAIGVAAALLSSCHGEQGAKHRVEPRGTTQDIFALLAWAQDKLFDLGADLPIGEDDVAALERAIDSAEETLPALDNFIHPGGSEPGAMLHLARAICRRAERRLLSLRDRGGSIDAIALRYLNRLSDALFVWARAINAALGVPESRWRKSSSPP